MIVDSRAWRPERAYPLWLSILGNLFVANLYVLATVRSLGVLTFVVWTAAFAWVIYRRAAMTGQVKEGRIAMIAGAVGGLGLHGTVINIQSNVFPHYIAAIFGISGVVGFGIAILFAISLIRGWYPP